MVGVAGGRLPGSPLCGGGILSQVSCRADAEKGQGLLEGSVA